MDLYDDIDTKPRASQIDGWSSGIKMLQQQLIIKKAQVDKVKESKKPVLLTPAVNLRAKKTPLTEDLNGERLPLTAIDATPVAQPESTKLEPATNLEDCWDFNDEYDPHWPNEYEKLKEKHRGKDKRVSGDDRERVERSNSGGRNDERGGGGGGGSSKRNRTSRNSRSSDSPPAPPPPAKFSGFGQRHSEEDRYSPPTPGSVTNKGGVAIAPPPSLQEISIANESGDGSSNVTIPYSASSVAAKIMAKYGFKDGQGLGKQEQGMSMALQVEKTSKRGGRIIHEKDVFLPPSSANLDSPPSASMAPPPVPMPVAPVAAPVAMALAAAGLSGASAETANNSGSCVEPSITEIMKAPSKVVLLRNMVGPGDVDEELEPEVKDECNTKYGEVISVIIHEQFGTPEEDAVKIYVEFKRIESAIKAVVDLNGRFFGGRQVRAGFYNFDKFKSFQLT